MTCRKDVTVFGRRLFTLTGLRHRWDTDVETIPDAVVFCRVNCERCGYPIDGVKLKRIIEEWPEMGRRL